MIAMLAALATGLSTLTAGLPPIRREPSITYLDRSGAVIGVRGSQYGPPVDLDQLPPYVPAAFVAIEDRRFYYHFGFDPWGMARASSMADLSQGAHRCRAARPSPSSWPATCS